MRFRFILIALLLAAPQLWAECAPPRLLRMVTQADSPKIQAGSFASRPKTVYRLGAKFARVEEQADREQNLHLLLVASAPDSWVVNRLDATGRHFVDPDPKGNVSVPLFPPGSFDQSFPTELTAIQMGCEIAFFESHRSPIKALKTRDGDKVQQAFGVGGWKLVLVRRDEKGPPEMLFVFHGNDIALVLRYLTFEEFPSPDMELFAKPKGIAFTEGASPK
ncbi:MAG: hypothetical protein AABO58_22365 [Acidobacteriota bacterium]